MAPYNIDWKSGGDEVAPVIPGKTDISLPEKTTDSASTSLVLTGKGVPNYGEIQQENFLWLMEHFASNTAPGAPTVGQLWFNSTIDNLRLYTLSQTWDTVTREGGNHTVTGSWTFTSPVEVAAPVGLSDATTKQYVDSVAQGLSTKPAAEIVVINAASLGAFTYNNGVSGVGATLTANSNIAFPTIDGVTLNSIVAGENGVLIAFAGGDLRNGRYNLTQVGSGSAPWILTRCGLCDESDEIPGSYTFIKQGTTYAGTGWVQTVTNPATFVVGTDPVFATQFSAGAAYTAGAGLTLTGNDFAVGTASVSRIVVNANDIDLATVGVAGTYGGVTTDAYGRVTAGQATLGISNGGTNLSSLGTANQVLGVNAGASALEYKTITAGSNIAVTYPAPGVIQLDASGGSPAGASGSVQYNNAGVFGAASNFIWDNPNTTLRAPRFAAFGIAGYDNVNSDMFVSQERGLKFGQAIGANTTGDWVFRATSSALSLYRFNGTYPELFRFDSAGVGTAVNWVATSDRRLKEDLQVITGALEKITHLTGYTFRWVGQAGDKRSVGLMAQEVQEQVPEAVFTNSSNDHLALNYDGLLGAIVEAIKELNDKVEALKARVDHLGE
jgi:hypothetical protein